ncbi:MAG: ATP-binding protein [Pseudolabrys sp.]|nr:ATP-binding protein [Pseudolabrys sp.]
MKEIEIRIVNRQEDMPRAVGMISRFVAENELAPAMHHDLNVVVDEALNNIISHGYDTDAADEITIRLEHRQNKIVVQIEDGGRTFDPLQIASPDFDASLRTRKVGGLGVHFMRSLMDNLSYKRIDGKNRLELTKTILP